MTYLDIIIIERQKCLSFKLRAVVYKQNKTMIVSIKAEDLFKTSNPKYSYYSNGIKQKFNNYYDSQHLEITLIKKIGNIFNKAKPTFQSSNSEERNRL